MADDRAYFQRGGKELDFPKSGDSTDRKNFPAWCEDIGASKTSNTGYWIFILRKIKIGLVLITPQKI